VECRRGVVLSSQHRQEVSQQEEARGKKRRSCRRNVDKGKGVSSIDRQQEEAFGVECGASQQEEAMDPFRSKKATGRSNQMESPEPRNRKKRWIRFEARKQQEEAHLRLVCRVCRGISESGTDEVASQQEEAIVLASRHGVLRERWSKMTMASYHAK
jgi:hypothetical protein